MTTHAHTLLPLRPRASPCATSSAYHIPGTVVCSEKSADRETCRYPGVSQGFHYIYPAITIAVKVRAELVQGIQWLLGKKSGSVA